MPFFRNVPFDSFFLSTPKSRIPIINTEPRLFSRTVGHVFVEVISLGGRRVFSGWCLAERCTGTRHVNTVTPENGLRARLHPSRKTIPDETSSSYPDKLSSLGNGKTILLGNAPYCLGWKSGEREFSMAAELPGIPKIHRSLGYLRTSMMVRQKYQPLPTMT